jgi:hypothetical protein
LQRRLADFGHRNGKVLFQYIPSALTFHFRNGASAGIDPVVYSQIRVNTLSVNGHVLVFGIFNPDCFLRVVFGNRVKLSRRVFNEQAISKYLRKEVPSDWYSRFLLRLEHSDDVKATDVAADTTEASATAAASSSGSTGNVEAAAAQAATVKVVQQQRSRRFDVAHFSHMPRDASPFHVGLIPQAENISQQGCKNGAGFLCIHRPQCIFLSPQYKFLDCMNKSVEELFEDHQEFADCCPKGCFCKTNRRPEIVLSMEHSPFLRGLLGL